MNFSDNDYVFNDIGKVSVASNISTSKNPPFELEDFLLMYPQFDGMNELPDDIIEMYIQFANDVVNIKNWGNQWKLGMCLFVAHFCTVYLMSFQPAEASAAAVIASAQTKGLVSSKSVGDVSVSYDFSLAVQNVEEWGQFNLTIFGNQFASLSKLMNMGGMYVR
jgi:hypothetical protein